MSGWSSQGYVVPDTPLTFPSLNSLGLSQTQARSTDNDLIMVPETPSPSRRGDQDFCTKENLLNAIAYINQELELMGFPCISVESIRTGVLDSIFLMNRLNDVLVVYHKTMAVKEELEMRNHRLSCDLDHQQSTCKRLKRSKEQIEREACQEKEKLRQLNCKYKSMSSQIKTDEEELRKLSAMQSSRDLQYKHEQKKKEKELIKLRERLHQLIADKAPDRKVGMDIMSLVGGSDGRRATWKTVPGKQEEEMYQVLVNNYEESRQELMQENAELRDCLLSLQRELSTLLKRTGDMNTSTATELSNHANLSNSSVDEDEEQDSLRASRLSITDLDDGYFQMPCDIMRNQIQQMFKDTCDQISQSMKKSLVRNINKGPSSSRRMSQSSFSNSSERSLSDRRNSVSESAEVERLKKQIQNYKAIIDQQEDLIQQTLTSHSHSMESTFFHESQVHKEKENLSEQRKLFAEERANFEKERRSFTEAAIRLAKEKKNFDADRAALLKQQFLSLSPFKGSDLKRSKADGHSNRLLPATPVFSPAKSEPKPEAADLPTTAELFKALGLTKNTKDAASEESKPLSQEGSSSQSHPNETSSPSSFHPGSQDVNVPNKSTRLSFSPHDSTGNPSPTANGSDSNSFSPKLAAIKASLMKKHLERSKSKD